MSENTSTTEIRPPSTPEWVAAEQAKILTKYLTDAGWTTGDVDDEYTAPEGRAKVSVIWWTDEEQPDAPTMPFYQLHVDSIKATGNKVDMMVGDAQLVLDVLARLRMVPAPPRLVVEDIAAALSAELRREVKPTTVRQYLAESKPGKSWPTRHAARPFPEAEYAGTGRGTRPSWHPMDVPAVIAWRRGFPRYPRA